MSDDIPGYAIGRLSLQPGDVLVIKCSNYYTMRPKWITQIHDSVKKNIGDIPVMVIGPEVDLAILTKAEIDARTEPARLPPQRIVDLPTA